MGDGSVDTVDHRHRDVQRQVGHVQVGRLVHVDMAVPDAGLDGGHLGIAYDRLDQARSPAWNHHIDQAAGLNQVSDGGAVGSRQQLDRVGRQLQADQRGA
ncbi:Uncharacterised protein [Mycobacterium tuberculosis]|nr:Uncharacterised protein [Mycobacterium tuberculosis]